MTSRSLPPEIQEKHDQYMKKMLVERKGKKIPLHIILDRVKKCTVRRTKPIGPMTVCYDMMCFSECIIETKKQLQYQREKEKTENES